MPRTIRQEIFSAHADALSTLAAAFPEAVKDGEVDWDALKELLADAPSTGPEKFELTWTGKAEARREAGRDVVGRTLRFCPEESKDMTTTENLYIEGDNLEVLKLLRENYYGPVKMIYIDPPYNTGNDFVYRDNFRQSEVESELLEGNIDEEGIPLVKNSQSSNRFHANWLSMIYPRLRCVRDLLSQNGVIFISINDKEIHHLRSLCDEIFGENNFIGEFIWQSKKGGGSDNNLVVSDHEYVISYARAKAIEGFLNKIDIEAEPLDMEDSIGSYRRGRELNKWGSNSRREDRPTMYFPIPGPNGEDVYPIRNDGTEGCWRWGKPAMLDAAARGNIEFVKREDGSFIAYEKIRDIESRSKSYRTLLKDNATMADGSKAIKELFDEQKVFDFPKPLDLISTFLGMSTKRDDLVMDFFSGSGTTAHAVMEMNAGDGGRRKFICVQLAEPTQSGHKALECGYAAICDIGKERIRRAGNSIKNRIQEQQSLFSANGAFLDVGFKVLKVADTVIRWTHDALRPGEQMIVDEAAMSDKDRIDFMPGYTDIDVVYEIALRQNDIPLSAPIRLVPEAGKRTYLFAN